MYFFVLLHAESTEITVIMMRKTLLVILGVVLAATGCRAQEVKNHNLEVAKNLEIFNALYKNLDLMYVDTLDANKVVTTGIDAMLRSLDPYTEYYLSLIHI